MEYQAISVTGVQIKINPFVWYSHFILAMKTSILNSNQRGTHITNLSVMTSWCSPDSRHGGPNRHLANVCCSNFRYTIGQSNSLTERQERKKWTREDNRNVLHCYFKSNLEQKVYRKIMIEIWTESARFNAKNQRLADQAKRILKKG